MLTPPGTDYGTIPNLKFSFATAHNRLNEGGWAGEVTARELPILVAHETFFMLLTFILRRR
jgi:oxalate decarboxylase